MTHSIIDNKSNKFWADHFHCTHFWHFCLAVCLGCRRRQGAANLPTSTTCRRTRTPSPWLRSTTPSSSTWSSSTSMPRSTPPTNNVTTGNAEFMVAAASSSLSLPSFWLEHPHTWFNMCESAFATHNIVRFTAVLRFSSLVIHFGRKMGLLETLGHLKNPPSSPFGHSPPYPARAAYSAILSLSIGRYVYLIISVPIFALPYILIIMYVYWLNIPSKKTIYAALLDIILHLIRMHFDIRQTNSKGKTKKKLILLKPYSRFLTDC